LVYNSRVPAIIEEAELIEYSAAFFSTAYAEGEKRMKTRLIGVMVILMLVASASAFAGDGFWIGPTALYDGQQWTLDQILDGDSDVEFDSEYFLYGVEARLDFSVLQASANAIYYSDAYTTTYGPIGETIELNTNLGLYLDLGIAGLGIGAGPRYLLPLDYDEEIPFGSNIKFNADLILGSTLVSGYFMGYVDDLEAWLDDETATFGSLKGKVGVSVLFQL
jgi:hypothetical protein